MVSLEISVAWLGQEGPTQGEQIEPSSDFFRIRMEERKGFEIVATSTIINNNISNGYNALRRLCAKGFPAITHNTFTFTITLRS